MLTLPKWSDHRSKAYFLGTLPEKDRATEGEMLQCIHCQFTWKVQPGSGIKRGWCSSCGGVTCEKPTCNKHCGGMLHFMRQIEASESKSRWLAKLGIGR